MWWEPTRIAETLRVLGGGYLRSQTRAFAEQVRRGATVIDVGAHKGYWTLLGARLTGPGGHLLAFEPEPRDAERLRRLIGRNRLANAEVVEAAVAAGPGTASFARGARTGTGQLRPRGDYRASTVALDDELASRRLTPDIIRINVAGAERSVLQGADRTLRGAAPVVFLSTHGPLPHTECTAILTSLGYTLRPLAGKDVEHSSELLCRPPAARR